MLAKTHIMSTMLTGGIVSFTVPTESLNYFLIALFIGSIFPDIDESGSYIGRRMVFVSLFLSIFIKHRGITHTILILLVYALIGITLHAYYMLGWIPWVTAGFILGNAIHIIGDMTTRSGVAILYPFYTGSLHLMPRLLRLQTGSIIEQAIILPLFSLLMGLTYYHLILEKAQGLLHLVD